MSAAGGSPRDVLIVTWNFPPFRSSGLNRVRNLLEALPRHGLSPVFLVPELSAYPASRIEPELDRLVPAGTPVYRSRFRDPFRRLAEVKERMGGEGTVGGAGRPRPGRGPWGAAKDLVHEMLTTPDKRIGWLPGALAAAGEAFSRHRIRAIVSTGPPWTAHLIAGALRRRHRVRWAADFRDPWLGNPFVAGSRWRRIADRRLEAAVVRGADTVVATTREYASTLSARYPSRDPGKFLAVPNGYSRREREEVSGWAPVPGDGSTLRILHTGTIYEDRDPAALLEALAGREDVRVDFRGAARPPARSAALLERRPEVARIARFLPGIPRQEVLREMHEADVLLLLQPAAEHQVPGKLFEYLVFGKPILALVGPGATWNLLAGSGLAEPVLLTDPAAIRRAVADLSALRPPVDPDRFEFGRLLEPLARRLLGV